LTLQQVGQTREGGRGAGPGREECEAENGGRKGRKKTARKECKNEVKEENVRKKKR
jgi:hypothetical protein